MRCQNCHRENSPSDKYCGGCGNVLINEDKSDFSYEQEIRRFAKEQEEAKKLEQMDDIDMESPTGLLKAQLRLLISIYRRLERLESKDKQGIKIVDFDMPFWSMVSFELKILLVGMFFLLIFSCIAFWLVSPILKDIISLPFIFSQ